MADEDYNQLPTNKTEGTQKGGGESFVPPSPSGAEIRTLKSDVRSMALSGGSPPSSGSPVYFADQASIHNKNIRESSVPTLSNTGLWKILFVFGIVAVLAAVVYFVYPLIFPSPSPTSSSTDSGGNLPDLPPHLNIPPFVHQSLFRIPADELLVFSTSYSTGLDPNPDEYRNGIRNTVSRASSTSELLEINIAKESGDGHLALTDFLVFSGFSVLDLDFLAENLNPDFTFFVFKDNKDYWPGLVAEFKKGNQWLILKSDINKLEVSDNLDALFLADPGTSNGVFEDVLISGQPVRVLKFGDGSAELIYGWLHGYMVISTSLDGLISAINHL